MIELKNVSYRTGNFELLNINLKVEKGQYFVLLGPTGAGKTLLIECIAGLHKARGKIFLDGLDATDYPPEKRNVGYLPQDYALFPFLTVDENINMGLKLRKIHEKSVKEKVNVITKMLDIDKILHRSPENLSGGEKQRVALARALATEPKFLLLDEPYSSLDAGMRHRLWVQMRGIHNELKKTCLHITHDLEEAYTLAEGIAVMIGGKIEQTGSREEVFYHPQNREVAKFLEIHNILEGKVISIDRKNESIRIKCNGYHLFLPYRNGFESENDINFCIAPHEIKIIRENRPIRNSLEDNLFKGRIISAVSHGMTYTLLFKISESKYGGDKYDFEIKIPAYAYLKLNLAEGKEIMVSLRKKAIHVFED